MKPILFNTEMVRAILEGRKTVTRRVVRPQPPDNDPHNVCFDYFENGAAKFSMRNRTPHFVKLPYQPGDILYVRETWQEKQGGGHMYKADTADLLVGMIPWRPSIHMPREAARLFLRVTDVRVERLQDMETPDKRNYLAEGAKDKHSFISAWDDTMKSANIEKYGWYANPWVWVIQFERFRREEAT